MKIILRGGGVMRSGPEREMVDDYIQRANGLARGTGFTSVVEEGIDLRSCKSRADETDKLLSGIDSTARLILFDERGKQPSSRDIAKQIGGWRDDGISSSYFLIGGADGFEPSALPAGVTRWAFGAQVWPHKLVRVMASEQIYRALSILAGTPYHRD
ncbi:23S rRNA (pseudouridine(1915)-N(3))-methyltransferase RlmH [Litorimonas sp. RW-G-Af-16]|uniref:23S rRNA (pseudouridine(1915)-N(3))-methyltransferase RlmH n=1 Tax=Litorimonas sp. RW-G-Af-16 TaxID=3241168 RepID=UPI00390C6A8F